MLTAAAGWEKLWETEMCCGWGRHARQSRSYEGQIRFRCGLLDPDVGVAVVAGAWEGPAYAAQWLPCQMRTLSPEPLPPPRTAIDHMSPSMKVEPAVTCVTVPDITA